MFASLSGALLLENGSGLVIAQLFSCKQTWFPPLRADLCQIFLFVLKFGYCVVRMKETSAIDLSLTPPF